MHVTTREGQTIAIDSSSGISLMEAIKEAGIDEVIALCGGCMSCATCHVYIEEKFNVLLPPATEDEASLLDSTSFRTEQSRLACQIELSESLDGLSAKIAPED
ncbi:2Fe-2S iron-sulfur cluster-binding protein [Caballeronia sp. J97]|uniref:2Fe-2S iron-sulfur cluster-binding protein n=1 Tax=Caballeronia sp. J97 TaxID=2805429 RepID=UPI002AB0C4B7|nr:2Fe-2S iron-sulfur cluster-binding protein [Caballeronia sp. J97]